MKEGIGCLAIMLLVIVEGLIFAVGYAIAGGYSGGVLAILIELFIVFVAIEISNGDQNQKLYGGQAKSDPRAVKEDVVRLRNELSELRKKL